MKNKPENGVRRPKVSGREGHSRAIVRVLGSL